MHPRVSLSDPRGPLSPSIKRYCVNCHLQSLNPFLKSRSTGKGAGSVQSWRWLSAPPLFIGCLWEFFPASWTFKITKFLFLSVSWMVSFISPLTNFKSVCFLNWKKKKRHEKGNLMYVLPCSLFAICLCNFNFKVVGVMQTIVILKKECLHIPNNFITYCPSLVY